MKFRFGVRPFEFQDFVHMIENGKLDISNVSYLDVAKKSIEMVNFQHFEFTADLVYVLPGLITKEVINQVKEFKDNNNYSCSVHLPLWAIELASPNEKIKSASTDCLIEIIELTMQLKPECWIIHPTGALTSEFTRLNLPNFAKDFMTNHFVNIASQSLEAILDNTGVSSQKIAVENVEFPFSSMVETIENLDLSICFDTGHLLAGFSGKWNDGVIEFIETYQDRIVELHLHDGTEPRIDHKPLGRYDLPVRELFKTLIDVKFTGPLVFEINLSEIIESINYIKKFVPEVKF